MNTLLGIDKNNFNYLNINNSPPYARVLGFNNKGKHLLKRIKQVSKIPVSTKFNTLYKSCNPIIHNFLNLKKLQLIYMSLVIKTIHPKILAGF